MARPTIFIDGEHGTTGLQIRRRLEGRDDVEMVSIDPAKRKDEAERARMLNGVDVAVLCLPDDASRQAVAMIDNPRTRVLDGSSGHRVTPGWTYGFPELSAAQEAAVRTAAHVRLWKRATSLGGVESLIEHRASIEGPTSPVPPDLLRLSVGIEEAADLIDDLAQALEAAHG